MIAWMVENELSFDKVNLDVMDWSERTKIITVEISGLTQFQYVELALIMSGDYKVEHRYLP